MNKEKKIKKLKAAREYCKEMSCDKTGGTSCDYICRYLLHDRCTFSTKKGKLFENSPYLWTDEDIVKHVDMLCACKKRKKQDLEQELVDLRRVCGFYEEYLSELTGMFTKVGVCEPPEGFVNRPQDLKACVNLLIRKINNNDDDNENDVMTDILTIVKLGEKIRCQLEAEGRESV